VLKIIITNKIGVDLRKKLMVLDIGANKGEFLSHILKSNSNVKVIAIEPNKLICMDSLEKLKIYYKDRLHIEYKALSKKSGKKLLYGANLMNGQLGSLLPINRASQGWSMHNEIMDSNKSQNIIVEVSSVEKFIKNSKISRIDLLKIDTQGTDLLILKEFLSLSEVKVGIVEVDIGKFNFGSRYKNSQNGINELILILRDHNFLITRIIPNNSNSDEFNIFFAKSFGDFESIFLTLDLKNNPTLSRFSKIQGLYTNSNSSTVYLLRRFIKKIATGVLHPRSSIKSLIIKAIS
jgi:FkbM family methyltransferase